METSIAVMDREALGGEREGPSTCLRAGCGNPTSCGKPYCLAHLDAMPYVRKLRHDLAERAAEDKVASGRKHVRVIDVNSVRPKEIVEHLETHGGRTFERLALDLELDTTALETYIHALVVAGRVRDIRFATRRAKIRRLIAPVVGAQRIAG